MGYEREKHGVSGVSSVGGVFRFRFRLLFFLSPLANFLLRLPPFLLPVHICFVAALPASFEDPMFD